MNTKFNESILIRDQKKTHREEGHVRMEAETGVILPQTKENQEPSESGIGKKGLSPRSFRGSTVLPML